MRDGILGVLEGVNISNIKPVKGCIRRYNREVVWLSLVFTKRL